MIDKTQGIAFCFENIWVLYKTKKPMNTIKIYYFKGCAK